MTTVVWRWHYTFGIPATAPTAYRTQRPILRADSAIFRTGSRYFPYFYSMWWVISFSRETDFRSIYVSASSRIVAIYCAFIFIFDSSGQATNFFNSGSSTLPPRGDAFNDIAVIAMATRYWLQLHFSLGYITDELLFSFSIHYYWATLHLPFDFGFACFIVNLSRCRCRAISRWFLYFLPQCRKICFSRFSLISSFFRDIDFGAAERFLDAATFSRWKRRRPAIEPPPQAPLFTPHYAFYIDIWDMIYFIHAWWWRRDICDICLLYIASQLASPFQFRYWASAPLCCCQIYGRRFTAMPQNAFEYTLPQLGCRRHYFIFVFA